MKKEPNKRELTGKRKEFLNKLKAKTNKPNKNSHSDNSDNGLTNKSDINNQTISDNLTIDWVTALEEIKNCLIYTMGLREKSDRTQWVREFTGYEGKLKAMPLELWQKIYNHLWDKITYTKVYLLTLPLINKMNSQGSNQSDMSDIKPDISRPIIKSDMSDIIHNNTNKITQKNNNKQSDNKPDMSDNKLETTNKITPKNNKNKSDNNYDISDNNLETINKITPKNNNNKSDNKLDISDNSNNEGFSLTNGEGKIDPQNNQNNIDDSYIYITDNERLKSAIEPLTKEKVLGIDTETTGLNPHCDKLRLIQIASENNPTLIIDCFKCDVKLLQPLLTNEAVKIFHNAKFDIQFLMSKGLEVSQTIFDTQLAHQLINSGKSNVKSSLKAISEEYLGIELSKEERLTDWGKEELTKEQLRYSAIDSKILLPLREKLIKRIVSANLIKVAKMEFDCVLAVAMMEFNGMLLDVSQWQGILNEARIRKSELEVEIKTILKEKIANSTNNKSEQLTLIANDFDFSEEINLDSPSQLKEALNKADIKVNDTNSNTLKKLLPQYPEILKPLLEYKKVSKLISSFGDSLLKKINPITGRLHGSYWQLGSSAGRFTSSDPNLQQIPRNKEARSCFVASPNHKLIIADYSQIELRIASEVANDRTMIEAYLRGEDLHKLTASIVLNKPLSEVSKEDRQLAKACNFGLIYGQSVIGFRGYAESNYGIKLSENEAKKIMDNFFKSYSGLAQWHKKTKSRIYNQGVSETRTLSDRIRYFDNASPQQILNTPIQGTGADMLKLALGKLVSALKPFNGKVKILATVHDEIILEAHESIVSQVAKTLSEVMVNSGKEFLKRVPIEADSSIGNNWADK